VNPLRVVPRVLESSLLLYRALFSWANVQGYASTKVLMPILSVVFFIELGTFATGRANALYFAVGNALQVTTLNAVFGVIMTLGNERRFGTLPLLLASPANRVENLTARVVINIVDGVAAALLGLIAAVLLFRLDTSSADVPLFALCVLIVSATTCGLGLMLGSLSLVTRDVLTIANLTYFSSMVVCGVNFPVDQLPGPLHALSSVLPMTRGIAAARQAMTGASLTDVLPLLVGECVVGLAYATVGYIIFRWLETAARMGGSFEAV
jgi:ABC-2 type transport system permease protein